MTPIDWIKLDPLTLKVPALAAGLWTPVLEFVESGIKVKIIASGTWEYLPGAKCGPDGHALGGVFEDTLVPTAPVGALVGKIGGGTCEKPDTSKTTVFGIGTFCVISIGPDASGPLFLAMNDRLAWSGRHSGELTIEIFEAR